MDYVLVFLLGIACAVVPAALYAASQRRPAAAPAAPAQPPAPIIVLPPAPQPVTNNYTYTEIHNDNRRVTFDPTATSGMPLLATRERELAAQRGERRFKVVGEQEEW